MTDELNRPSRVPGSSPEPLDETRTDGDITSSVDSADSPRTAGYSASSTSSAISTEDPSTADRTYSDGFGDDKPSDEPVFDEPSDEPASDEPFDERSDARSLRERSRSVGSSALGAFGRFVREIVIIVAVALIASALLRAFVVQAFFVPSGSMLPTIQVHDRILVSRIGDISRGEVVVFEDPGNWIPADEQASAPSGIRKALEFVGVLPASGHEHLVKRVIGLPGDHVICCTNGKLTINGVEVDESRFIKPGSKRADNVSFDVIVPAGTIFVLGDNRYVSGDSSRHPNGQEAFVPMDLVTGRAFAIIWPRDNIQVLHIPSAYDAVPNGQTPPEVGTFTQPEPGNN
jgi:signal peptidase I